MSGDASNSITEYGAEFHLPLSEESEAEIWLLHRMQGVCQINLGSAKAPLNLHNQLPDNCIVHRLLANLQQAPSPSLALHLSDPEPLLSPPQIQLLQSPYLYLDWPYLPQAAVQQDGPRMDVGRHARGQLDRTASAESAQALLSTKAAAIAVKAGKFGVSDCGPKNCSCS
ncbi:hypothetical protein WJX79_009066 [Trebouxia sp. C0005]